MNTSSRSSLLLRDAGLFLVYMGIESGNESGLEVLFKEMTVAENLAAGSNIEGGAGSYFLMDSCCSIRQARFNRCARIRASCARSWRR